LILRRGVGEELLPQFVARRLGWGATGIVLAAIAAASLAWLSSGLLAMVTSTAGLARHQHGSTLILGGRGLTPLFATAIAVTSISMSQSAGMRSFAIAAADALGGPLLALFLLGMLSRRATAHAVLIAALAGVAVAMG